MAVRRQGRDIILPRNVSKETSIALEERFGVSTLDSDGQPICHRKRRGNKGLCINPAGEGTAHPGYGPCHFHGGDKLSPEKRELESRSYHLVVKHKRLREILEYEDARGQVDNLDSEIVLIRSMIRLLAERFGMVVEESDAGSYDIIEDSLLAFEPLRAQATDMVKLVDALSGTIKRKYEVLQIAQAVVPRETVRAYVSQIQSILNQTLRNRCPNCGFLHNMQERCLTALALLGSL